MMPENERIPIDPENEEFWEDPMYPGDKELYEDDDEFYEDPIDEQPGTGQGDED